jgi:hypothetical protein
LWATKAISAEEGEAGSTTGEGSDFESDGESRVGEPGDCEERLDGRSAFLLSCMLLHEVVEKNLEGAWPNDPSIKAHFTAEF